jgi:hypothetical protein
MKASKLVHGAKFASDSATALHSGPLSPVVTDSDAHTARHLTQDEIDDLMAVDTLQVIITRLPPNAPDVWKSQLADLRHFSWLVITFVLLCALKFPF